MNYKVKHLKKMRKALQSQILEIVGKGNNTPLRGILAKELIVIEELIQRYEKQME